MVLPRARRLPSARMECRVGGAHEREGVSSLAGTSIGAGAVLLGAGVLAGVVGSAGGTASLISYPALVAVGIPALPANVTNAVAVMACLPGSALGSRLELRGRGPQLLRLAPLAVIGGVAGAVLLLVTPAAVFGRVVPFLVALAAVALLVQPRVGGGAERHPGKRGRLVAHCGLFAAWVYDGYWGAGAGVMTLAVLMLTVETELARANAVKNVLLGVADVACSVVFVLYGPVRWASVVPLALGFLAGSRVGPALARRIPQNPLRIMVALAGLGFAAHLWLNPN